MSSQEPIISSKTIAISAIVILVVLIIWKYRGSIKESMISPDKMKKSTESERTDLNYTINDVEEQVKLINNYFG
jgi:hypothetical protein